MIAATVRVRRPSGALSTFYAVNVQIDGGLITAKGHWGDDRQRRCRTYTWRSRQVVAIRWAREVVTA